MKTPIPVVTILILSALVWGRSLAQDGPCLQCCDYQPSYTPGVFSILRGEKGNTGAPGQHGSAGKAGPKGETGVKGEKGDPSTRADWSAFSVARTSNLAGGEEYKTVTYDTTTVNVGDDMNANTGVFTCFIPGAYFFTFTTMKDNNRYVAAFIMLNDSPKARIFADDNDWEGMVGQSVTLNLVAGDRVWIRIDKKSEHSTVLIYSSYKRHTVFNGHLVFPNFNT